MCIAGVTDSSLMSSIFVMYKALSGRQALILLAQ